jgi:hydrogenase maturation protease
MSKSICEKKRLIFGCRSPRISNNGFGSEVIRWLETLYVLPKDTECLDAGTAIHDFLFDILLLKKKPSQIIIIDTMNFAHGEPGEIKEIDISDIQPSTHSDHPLRNLHTINMLNIFRKQTTTDIRILVTQPAEIPSKSNSGLYFYVRSSLPQMCDRIIHIIENKPTILSQYKDRRSIVRID